MEASTTAGEARKASQENGERSHAGQAAVADGAAAVSLSIAAERPPTSGARSTYPTISTTPHTMTTPWMRSLRATAT